MSRLRFILDHRAATAPWSSIAADLSLDTDGTVSVSRETLRLWYGDVAA